MRTNFVLIDFENVRPEALERLDAAHFRVLVFVGAGQSKVPIETATALQRMGSRAEYIRISGNGPNALDFHIAFHIGRLSAREPDAFFHVISKDTGFDPLIAHLKGLKILAGRVTEVADIPLLGQAGPAAPGKPHADAGPAVPAIVVPEKPTPVVTGAEARLKTVLERLSSMKAARPRTVKTLTTTIATVFQKKIGEAEILSMIRTLKERGIVVETGQGDRIDYRMLA